MALACDAYPFSGYPRWESNERWDVISRRESPAGYVKEERHFARLARMAKHARLPSALRASVEFRHYLAARDVFLRKATRSVAAAYDRRLLAPGGHGLPLQVQEGLRAARRMWNLTRDPKTAGPNEQIVRRDAARLRVWMRGEPVFGGAWQLCYRVWNFAPAVQLVGVEQQQADGSWKTLQACHTIEFQTRAAQPRSSIVREHAAPVDWDGNFTAPPRVRVFLRGIGEVKIGAVELVAAGQRIPAKELRRGSWLRLGRPAPRHGWPVFGESETRVFEWRLDERIRVARRARHLL
jgi:hypothetical protein